MTALAPARKEPATTKSTTSPPQLFRKNAGAIQIWNSISILQRKAFSALLINAYEDLPNLSIVSHQIPVSVLAHLSGFNSNNTQYLKDALTGLVTTALQWNIQRVDGKEAWAVSATLASARIQDGMVIYSFSHELRTRLYNPDVYAQLDLSIIREFRSGYALALYENCKLFSGEGETPDFTPRDLRGLLGAGDNPAYDNFGRFMDKVIKPATAEVNRLSDLHVEPILTRESRRVTAVRFKIEGSGEEAQASIPPNPLLGRDAELVMRVQSEIGLGYGQVMKLFEEYPDSHILAVLEYVKDRYTNGKVQKGKIAGYFLTVVKKATPDSLTLPQSSLDLPPAQPMVSPEEAAAAAAEAEQKAARKKRLDEAEASWLAKTAEDQERLLTDFMAHLSESNRIIYDSLRRNKNVEQGTMGYRFLLNWLVDGNEVGEGTQAQQIIE